MVTQSLDILVAETIDALGCRFLQGEVGRQVNRYGVPDKVLVEIGREADLLEFEYPFLLDNLDKFLVVLSPLSLDPPFPNFPLLVFVRVPCEDSGSD